MDRTIKTCLPTESLEVKTWDILLYGAKGMTVKKDYKSFAILSPLFFSS